MLPGADLYDSAPSGQQVVRGNGLEASGRQCLAGGQGTDSEGWRVGRLQIGQLARRDGQAQDHDQPTGQERNMSGADPPFERKYPSITKWVRSFGWVEFGQLDWYRAAMVCALDEGGLVWEGKAEYAALDDLLRDLDAGLAGWFEANVTQEAP